MFCNFLIKFGDIIKSNIDQLQTPDEGYDLFIFELSNVVSLLFSQGADISRGYYRSDPNLDLQK